MVDPYIDTDVIIRLLTNDDPLKQQQAASLFEAVERNELSLCAPDTMIADAVYVLASPRLYHLPRTEVQALLIPLLRLTSFQVANKRALIGALDLYGGSNLDFGDAMIIAAMRQDGATRLYSYDTDFDGLPGIERLELAISESTESAGGDPVDD